MGAGYVNAGGSLSFTLSDLTCGQSWPSTDTSHVLITRGDALHWTIDYDDAGHCSYPDGDFNDMVVSVTLVPARTSAEMAGSGNPGEPEKNCTQGDPVTCATGNFWEESTDLSVPGPGPSLDLTRSYNSTLATAATSPGRFGYGWSDTYGAHLTIAPNGDVTAGQGNGSTLSFALAADGTFTAPPTATATLAQDSSNGVYTLTYRDQTALMFNRYGTLGVMVDREGMSTVITYSGNDVAAVIDATGRRLAFAYNADGTVASVTDPASRVVKYGYDSSGNLAMTTAPVRPAPRR